MDNTSTLNGKRQELAERIHANAVAKGFWDDESLSHKHYAMLVITELSEAVEADRKGRKADVAAYNTHIERLEREYREYNYPGTEEEKSTALHLDKNTKFEQYIKDSVSDELADAYIRLLDFSKGYEIHILDRFKAGVSHKDEAFTERILMVVGCVVGGYYSQALDRIEDLAEDLGIDLLWHIEEKMRYNESRPRLHGKEY